MKIRWTSCAGIPLLTASRWVPNKAVKVAGFFLHAGVAPKANQRDKLERLCRYIALKGGGQPWGRAFGVGETRDGFSVLSLSNTPLVA